MKAYPISAALRHSVLAMTLTLAACGSSSETEITSGSVTDPDTGKTTDYSVKSSGSGDDASVTIKTDEGEVRIGQAIDGQALPAGLKLYPGAKATGGMAASGKGEGETGGMVMFETNADISAVAEFYRKQMTAAGIKIEAEAKAGGTVSLSGKRTGTNEMGVQVNLSEQEGKVTGMVIYGEKS